MDRGVLRLILCGIVLVLFLIYAIVGVARGKYDSDDMKSCLIALGITLLVAGIPAAIFIIWLYNQ